MADANRFGIAHLVLAILATSITVGAAMYSVTSNLIMAEVVQYTQQVDKEREQTINLELNKLEARIGSKIGDVEGALEKIEESIDTLELQVVTLEQQQIADREIRSMVQSVGTSLQALKLEINTLNERTARVSELADKVDELNSQVIQINEKVQKK
ncbi:hypothetical protein [Vibrio phage VCPH]|nr:hypothetical protein [Vibrio phage VCPH]